MSQVRTEVLKIARGDIIDLAKFDQKEHGMNGYLQGGGVFMVLNYHGRTWNTVGGKLVRKGNFLLRRMGNWQHDVTLLADNGPIRVHLGQSRLTIISKCVNSNIRKVE